MAAAIAALDLEPGDVALQLLHARFSIAIAGGLLQRQAALRDLEAGTGTEERPGRYRLGREGRTLDVGGMIDLWDAWTRRYPIVSIEDGLGEEEWAGWAELRRRIGAFLSKDDPNDRRIINCEDEVYIGAALGCHYGIMRHPLADPLGDGLVSPLGGLGVEDRTAGRQLIGEASHARTVTRRAQPRAAVK